MVRECFDKSEYWLINIREGINIDRESEKEKETNSDKILFFFTVIFVNHCIIEKSLNESD